MSEITPELLLGAYRIGVFPMAEGRDDPDLYWVAPNNRGIIPLEHFHVPRRLKSTVRSDRFEIRVDTAFREVMEGCASPEAGRHETWINAPILDLYTALFDQGDAHSVECWQDGALVGGLYGVAIGAAFFAESMFSLRRDASKVALVHLAARLRHGGFVLLDTQFTTDHLKRFGAIDVPKADYMGILEAATADDMAGIADFHRLGDHCSGAAALQFIIQTS